MANGGPMSCPATMVDLELAICKLYEDVNTAKRIKWHIPGVQASQTVVGLQHVDDALVCSKIYCTECLRKGVKRLWPKDVGTTLEGVGPVVPFLHAEIRVLDTNGVCPIYVVPLVHNRDFANGTTPYPQFSKVSPLFAKKLQPPRPLQHYLTCELFNVDQLLEGHTQHAAEPVCLLVAEMFRLQWPFG